MGGDESIVMPPIGLDAFLRNVVISARKIQQAGALTVFTDANLLDELVTAFERDCFKLSSRLERGNRHVWRVPLDANHQHRSLRPQYRLWHGLDDDNGDFLMCLKSVHRQATFRIMCSFALVASSCKTLKYITTDIMDSYRERLELHLSRAVCPFSPTEHFKLAGGTMSLCEAAEEGDILKVRQCLAVGISSNQPWGNEDLVLISERQTEGCQSWLRRVFGGFQNEKAVDSAAHGEGTPLECARRYGCNTGDLSIVRLLLASGADPTDALRHSIDGEVKREAITGRNWGWKFATSVSSEMELKNSDNHVGVNHKGGDPSIQPVMGAQQTTTGG